MQRLLTLSVLYNSACNVDVLNLMLYKPHLADHHSPASRRDAYFLVSDVVEHLTFEGTEHAYIIFCPFAKVLPSLSLLAIAEDELFFLPDIILSSLT